MRFAKLLLFTASVLVVCGVAYGASKDQELGEMLVKPWSYRDIPQLNPILADVNEIEPNNTCPGEPYVLGNTYHATLTPLDQDWISFSANQGDEITIATDSDLGSTTDTYLELYDQTCVGLLAFNDDGGPGLFSLILDFPAPYTGTYHLKVRGFSSTTQGLYQLIANVQAAAACPGFCPIGLYKASKINVELPIADLETITTPAIKFNPQPGCLITDVIVDMNIEHTWVGDLTITLQHTDTFGQVRTVDLVQRPGVPQSTFGCSGDLISDPEDKYYFGTQPALGAIGECSCPAAILAGCYAVAPEQASPGLGIFNGLPIGDDLWQLIISDGAAGDVGVIHNFSIHILCGAPVSTQAATWGEVKSVYRDGTE